MTGKRKKETAEEVQGIQEFFENFAMTEQLVEKLVPGAKVVAKPYSPLGFEEALPGGVDYLYCGEGPERAVASVDENPNWLRWKASNYMALADALEERQKNG